MKLDKHAYLADLVREFELDVAPNYGTLPSAIGAAIRDFEVERLKYAVIIGDDVSTYKRSQAKLRYRELFLVRLRLALAMYMCGFDEKGSPRDPGVAAETIVEQMFEEYKTVTSDPKS